MGKVLKHNLMLRRDDQMGTVVALLKGEELPAWAEGLVGDHVFKEAAPEDPKPKRASRNIPNVPKKESTPAENPVPSRKASVPEWKSFLKKAGVKDIPTSITREELIALATERFPEIEIEEDEE